MRTKHVIAVTLAVVTVAALCFAVMGEPGTPGDEPETIPVAAPVPPEVSAQDVESANEVKRLEQEVPVVVPRAAKQPATHEPGPEAEGSAERREERQPPPRMSTEEVDRVLSDSHRVQSRDPEWSRETEVRLDTLFSSGQFPGTTLAESDCRSTFCRIVVVNEDNAAFESLLGSMATTPPFNTEGFMRNIGDENSPTLVIYFARDGENLRDLLAAG